MMNKFAHRKARKLASRRAENFVLRWVVRAAEARAWSNYGVGSFVIRWVGEKYIHSMPRRCKGEIQPYRQQERGVGRQL